MIFLKIKYILTLHISYQSKKNVKKKVNSALLICLPDYLLNLLFLRMVNFVILYTISYIFTILIRHISREYIYILYRCRNNFIHHYI